MKFVLRLQGYRPTRGDLVLEQETPLEGLRFVAEVGAALRRSIDNVNSGRHITLGALATYEMNVPQSIAVMSGRFERSNTYTVVVSNDFLSHYIFYGASLSNAPSNRPCYPYMSNSATLNSYIDELGFIEDWAMLGFPSHVAWRDCMCASSEADFSGTALDESEIDSISACDGCTVHRRPPRPRPGGYAPPPPPPQQIHPEQGPIIDGQPAPPVSGPPEDARPFDVPPPPRPGCRPRPRPGPYVPPPPVPRPPHPGPHPHPHHHDQPIRPGTIAIGDTLIDPLSARHAPPDFDPDRPPRPAPWPPFGAGSDDDVFQ